MPWNVSVIANGYEWQLYRQELVQELLTSSPDYNDRVAELKTVPDKNKTRLIKRVAEVRKKLA